MIPLLKERYLLIPFYKNFYAFFFLRMWLILCLIDIAEHDLLDINSVYLFTLNFKLCSVTCEHNQNHMGFFELIIMFHK